MWPELDLPGNSMPGFLSNCDLSSTAPVPLAPRCGRCGLYKGCKSPKMPWTGQGKRKVLVVAEAPGREEDKQNTQLVGDSGQRLRKHLRKVGVDLDRDCWKTNSVVCCPQGETPTSVQIEACRPLVWKAVKELKPQVILLLGAVAVESVVGKVWGKDVGPIGRWVGWQIPSHDWNCRICPTWHPSYLLRQNDPELDLWFNRRLEETFGIESRPWQNGPPKYEQMVEVVYSPEDAAGLVRRRMEELDGPVTIDYETDRLKPDCQDSRIVSCALYWPGTKAFAFPWFGEAVAATGELLRSKVPKIAANLKFEDRWTRFQFGHGVRNWHWDTMQAAHVLDNRSKITGVKFQAYVRLGQPTWDSAVSPYLKGEGGNGLNRIDRVGLETLLRYNAMDALMEYRIALLQMEEMGEDGGG